KTGLYLVPLRALAHEKFEELQAFASLGVCVVASLAAVFAPPPPPPPAHRARGGLSIGDFDLTPQQLDRLDILVATSEKADALLRKGAPWLDRLGAPFPRTGPPHARVDRGPRLR